MNGAYVYSTKSSTYKGTLTTQSFQGLKRTFSGHFHVYQELKNNFVYAGAPLQV